MATGVRIHIETQAIAMEWAFHMFHNFKHTAPAIRKKIVTGFLALAGLGLLVLLLTDL